MAKSQEAQGTKRRTTKCSHTDGPGHDCAYVEWRQRIAQSAEHAADARWGAAPAGVEAQAAWRRRWDAEYHRAIERLMHDPFVQARLARGVA